MFKEYNHKEYMNCKNVADFAKLYAFKDKSGEILGRNKIFRILRELGILDKENMPYQSYMKYFRGLEKEYDNGMNVYKKTIIFITSDGQSYLANKINDYLEKESPTVKAKTNQIKTDHHDINKNDVPHKIASPLDFDRGEALVWFKKLPKFMEHSFFAVQVKNKWNFSEEELFNG